MRKFWGIRGKISALLILGNFVLGIILIFLVGRFGTKNMRKALIDRGKVIAENLAFNCADLILEKDRPGIKHLITNSLDFESLSYIIVYDDKAQILGDTFNGQIPPELKISNDELAQLKQNKSTQLLNISQIHAETYDIWYPVEDGYIGYVRVGMNTDYVHQVIFATLKMITLVILVITVLGIVVVVVLAGHIINPIVYLTRRADEISQGNLDEPIQLKTGDEIERLAVALERLRESVKIALDRLKQYQSLRM